MEGQIISKGPELDESEIKGLIEDFETIGILLKGHLTVFSSPVLTQKSEKMCNEGMVLIKKFTHKCSKHYGISHLSK